jgi:hypothetical protein
MAARKQATFSGQPALRIYMRVLAAVILLSVFIALSCRKEYSFEGGAVPVIDTTPPPPPFSEFPICAACSTVNGQSAGQWSFQAAGAVFCGRFDTAVVSPSRTAFTFFGPSSCSPDTGMILAIMLEPGDTLNRNHTGLYTFRNAFYYYDRPGSTDIFRNRSQIPFPVTITSYDHSTRIARGSFAANVIRANGGSASVHAGQFAVYLP